MNGRGLSFAVGAGAPHRDGYQCFGACGHDLLNLFDVSGASHNLGLFLGQLTLQSG